MNKRWVSVAVALSAVTAIQVGPASAHGHDEHQGKPTVQVDTHPVTWTMVSSRCPRLPAGATLDGSGTQTDKVKIRIGSDGVAHVKIDSHADGTAVDQNGRTYEWRYDNTVESQNSVADPATFQGLMIDAFRLRGDGPIRLKNGFVADITDGPAGFVANPRSSYGDPFDFPTGGGLCDPL